MGIFDEEGEVIFVGDSEASAYPTLCHIFDSMYPAGTGCVMIYGVISGIQFVHKK